MTFASVWIDIRSPSCFKVAWAACRLELASGIDWRAVDLMRGEQRLANFLAINPLGQVPAMRVHARTLTESEAILDWLWVRAGRSRGAEGPWEWQWRAWCLSALAPAARAVAWERVFKQALGLGSPDPRALERALPVLDACLEHLDRHVTHADVLDPSKAGPAVLSIGSVMRLVETCRVDSGRFAELSAWTRAARASSHYLRTLDLLSGLDNTIRGD